MPELTVLEPISTGDVIDRAIRLYRRNFVPLISVVAVPALIYYASAMMFSFGYSQSLQATQSQNGFNPALLMMTLLGMAGYVVYLFAILGAVSGMSRAIGDHMMMGEPITFKKCWRFAARRLGDVTVKGVLFLPVLFVGALALATVFVLLFMGLAFVIGLGTAAGFPPWLTAVASGVLGIGSILMFVAVTLLLAARIVFVPGALMIEGRSAVGAFGRSFQLGGGRTWLRLGLIALFSYFVNLAVFFALVEPLMAVFWVNEWSVADLLLHPGWNAAYAAVSQISTLLVWPIWITTLTLLYFDTRVRKEGYDIELMTAGLTAPADPYPAGMPIFRPPVPQWSGSPSARQWVQTGPLGLGGYPSASPGIAEPSLLTVPPPGAVVSQGIGARLPENGPTSGQNAAASNDRGSVAGGWLSPASSPGIEHEPRSQEGVARVDVGSSTARMAQGVSSGSAPIRCAVCGLVAIPGAKYCISCGDLLQTDESNPAGRVG